MPRNTSLLRTVLWAGLSWAANWAVATGVATNAAAPGPRALDFDVFWPPRDPAEPPASAGRALLNGRVTVRLTELQDMDKAMCIRIALNRPSDEAARKFWHSQLAFPQYDWMKSVRVWDVDHRWLWPNLPYLLRLIGRERIERYGGVDPVKRVDNDFAAVLIRKYDADGEKESEATRRAPLVSAEWYPAGATTVDRFTVVHTAQSDEFTLHPGKAGESRQGRAGVWLVYADFMGAKVPGAWPKAPEYAGGILAFFEIKWESKPDGTCKIDLRQTVPKRGTDFDWQEWADETLASTNQNCKARLSDWITNSD